MYINPILLKDYYKSSHLYQYPRGTDLIFSNFTPRKSRMVGVNHSVFFGLSYFLKNYLHNQFKGIFFGGNASLDDSKLEATTYTNFMRNTLGDFPYAKHIEDLHQLGYLPLAIYALPELSVVPCGVPALVMYNTHPDYFWLPGMLESLMSCTLWGMSTSATIAREYRLLLDSFAFDTSDLPEFVDYQAHDFSMRGMFGVEAAAMSGLAHLQYFKGTDCIPAIALNQLYYGGELTISSVPASEHSVMAAWGKDRELECYLRLINTVHPEGIVSIVSDTYDLWHVVSNILPEIKDDIMKRNGKIVIRPDSGDPVDILCGFDNSPDENCSATAKKGLIECLWDIFGGAINSKGYKQLDPHIGAIYGDSITIDRCREICERLERKGFASTNVVFGIGSYTYQYNTRDTLGWAMKATYAETNGVGRAIYKDPITDDGTKKSHKGLLKVIRHGDSYKVLQEQTWDQFNEPDNELKLVFKDGSIIE